MGVDSRITMAESDAGGASSSLSALAMQHREISQQVLPQLDRHLALPLVQFLEDNDVYPKQDLLRAKYELLKPTNLVHYIESVRKELEGQEKAREIEEQTKQHTEQAIRRRDELREKADRVIETISDPNVAAALGQDKERNLATLREKYNVRVTCGRDWQRRTH